MVVEGIRRIFTKVINTSYQINKSWTEKEIKKIIFLVGILLVLVLVSCKGQTPSSSGANKESKMIDCGTNTACFSSAFKTCTPSKIYGGATEIMGGSPEACNIFMLSLDDPKYTGGQRLSMECTIKDTNTFKDEEMNAVGVIQKGSSCKGTLYDQMSKILNP